MNLNIISSEEEGETSALKSIFAYIAKADLKDGDRLPPERDLAAELGVSRRALRQALAQMEVEGQVWRGKRNGTILGRRAPLTSLSLDRSLTRSSPNDIMEARLVFEPAIAALAASKATASDLEKIENSLRRTAEVTDDESWMRWDGAFHLAIAEATRNEIFIAMVAAFNVARADPEWRSVRVAVVTPELRRDTVADHRAIWEALCKRLPEEARRAMRKHLVSVHHDLFE
jgi:DNA-binding FadR family transcriptional regulator